MKIVINGQEQNFAPITLAVLIEQLGMKQDRVAVELNRNIVPTIPMGGNQPGRGRPVGNRPLRRRRVFVAPARQLS